MKDLSNNNVIHIKKDGIEYLQYRKLLEYSKDIEHCYTLKPLDFNVTDENKILDEYDKICSTLGLHKEYIYKPKQTHSNNIKKVADEEPGIYKEEFQDTDGLITNKKNKILALGYADCISLLFYDPTKKVIGNIHSGWRGTYQEIARTAVEMLKKEYGVNPKDLIVCIGPSIRKCCFEVRRRCKRYVLRKIL